MGKWLFPLGCGIQNLGLAVIIGGMLVIGAIAAPVLFREFAAQRHVMGAALTLVFGRFDTVLLVSLGFVALGELLRLKFGSPQPFAPVSLIRHGLMVLMAGGIIYSALVINPSIATMQRAGVRPDASPQGLVFHRTHKLSEALYKGELLAAILVLMLNPFVLTAARTQP